MKVFKYNIFFLFICVGTLLSTSLSAQNFTITGNVKDANDDMPIPGANIIIEGTSTGTITDYDGNYELQASKGDVLIFSFVGYLKERIVINELAKVDIKLIPDIKKLDEVVVIGYGTSKKVDVTGSIASITAEDIKSAPVTSLDQAIQGRMAGVQVIQNDASPGGNVSVRIRGMGTIYNNDPLFVIDGVPVYSDPGSHSMDVGSTKDSPLNMINPSDIVSIDVLKDASATAIYGSRASNGVVIITTRRGESGNMKINYEFYTGFQKIITDYDVLSAKEWGFVENRIRESMNVPADPDFENYAGPDYNWKNALLRTGHVQDHQLSLTGGSEKSKYSISLGYHDNKGPIIETDFKRFSIRANSDHSVGKFFKMGNNLSLAHTIRNQIPMDGGKGSTLSGVLRHNRMLPIYNQDGTFAGATEKIPGSNIIADAMESDNKILRYRLLGNVFGEASLLKDLKFRTTLSFDLITSDQNYFSPMVDRPFEQIPEARLETFNSNGFSWFWDNVLNYTKTLYEKHKLTVMVGQSSQLTKNRYVKVQIHDFPNNSVRQLNASTGDPFVNGDLAKNALASLFGRINYFYNEKYLITATIRRDGSSRFGKNYRYGTFPSVSFAWRVSQESFMSHFETISNLKFRAGYGETGGQEIGNYPSYALMQTDRYSFNGNLVQGVSLYQLPNPNITWEASAQSNFGIDLSLFKNSRLQLVYDYFIKETKDMLLSAGNAYELGSISVPRANLGLIQNKGHELAFTSYNLIGAFKWNTSFNYTRIRNKVLELPDDMEIKGGGPSITKQGYPIGLFWGAGVEGIYQSQDEIDSRNSVNSDGLLILYQSKAKPGDLIFTDANGDGYYSYNDKSDLMVIGNPHPDYMFGITNNFSYKNFSLNVFVQGVQGADIFSTMEYEMSRNTSAHFSGNLRNAWQDTDPFAPGYHSNTVPRLIAEGLDDNRNMRYSSRYISDGSYVKIKSIKLSYDIPGSLVSKLSINKMMVYASINNLYTWTKYPGFDPEIGSASTSNALTLNVDSGNYPQSFSMIFGLKVAF